MSRTPINATTSKDVIQLGSKKADHIRPPVEDKNADKKEENPNRYKNPVKTDAATQVKGQGEGWF